MTYNYERFSLKHYDLMSFPGTRSGEIIDDHKLTDMDGNTVNLSDFRGQWLVIETGSLTCNLYSRNIEPMAVLRQQYPEVIFIMLYIREAHPGSKLAQHKNIEDKRQSARWLKEDLGEGRRILLDDLEGSMHRGIGALPNVIYVINPEGRVIYRRDWNLVKDLANVLENRDNIYPDKHTTTVELNPMSIKANMDLFKTVLRGGWDAMWDLFKEIPGFLIEHVKADRHFRNMEAKEKSVSNKN